MSLGEDWWGASASGACESDGCRSMLGDANTSLSQIWSAVRIDMTERTAVHASTTFENRTLELLSRLPLTLALL